MPKYIVVMAQKKRDYSFKSNDGNDVSMVEYGLVVTNEAGAQFMPSLSRSAKREAPKAGDELQGRLDESEKFGLQLKEDKQPGSGGGRGGYSGKPVEERQEIMAEKAVAEANLFLIGKGNFLLEMFKLNFATEDELKAHLKNFNGIGLQTIAKSLFATYKSMSAVPVEKPADNSPAENPDLSKKAAEFDRLPAEEKQEPTPGKMPDGSVEQVVKPEEIPF